MSPNARPRRDNSTEVVSRREEIIARAAELFAQNGVTNTSMQDIARNVKVRKASLYHFFASKEEMVYSVLQSVVEGPYSELRSIVESKRPAEEKLRRALRALGQAFQEQSEAMHILVRENLGAVLSQADYQNVITHKRMYTDLWRQLIREGQQRGEFRMVDDKIVTFGLIGSLNWMFAWFDPRGPMQGEEIAELLAGVFIGGLKKWPQDSFVSKTAPFRVVDRPWEP